MSEQLSENGKDLVKFMPQAVNALADRLIEKIEERILYGEKPQTNADRIRAMTDEELAIALYAGCSGRECPEGMWDNPLTEDEEDSLCLKCTIAWLKSPVEVDNGT